MLIFHINIVMESFSIFCRFFQFSEKSNKFEVKPGLTALALSKGQLAFIFNFGETEKIVSTVSLHAVCEFRVREMDS
jgi:hypothetical protein